MSRANSSRKLDESSKISVSEVSPIYSHSRASSNYKLNEVSKADEYTDEDAVFAIKAKK